MVLRVKTVEEALDMTGFSHYNLYLLLFYGCNILSMTLEFFGTFYIMPPMAEELGVTSSQQEIMTQMLIIGLFASNKIWAYLSDFRGRKRALRIALTISFLFGACAAFSPHWIVLTIFKLFSAIGVAGIFMSSFPLLIECTPKARRRAVVILSTSTFLVTLATMAVLSFAILSLKFSGYIPGLTINFTAWRLQCLLFALPSMFCLIGMKFIFESPKFLLTLEKEEEALEVLRGIYELNSRRSADNYKVHTVILDEDNILTNNMNCLRALWTRLKSMLQKPRMTYFTLVMKAHVGSYVSAYCYIVLMPVLASAFVESSVKGNTHLTVCEMVRNRQNTTATSPLEQVNETFVNGIAMTMVFTVGIALAVLNVIVNGLTKYVSRKRIILAIQILVTIAALCINFSPYGVLTSILFVCILCGILNLGLIYSYVGDIFPSFVMSLAVGLTAVAGLGPTSLVVTFIKKFINSNCEVVFYIVTGTSLFCTIIIIFLPTDETLLKNRKLIPETVPQEEESES